MMVLLFHFGYLGPGWIGVQLFFVLSGYLITEILLISREGHSVGRYVARFYWRRTLRIFPLYYFMLFCTVAAYLIMNVPEAFPGDWPWLFGYAANFARLRPTDLPTYVHTWSLALEEQFYLVWPLVIFFLPTVALKRALIGTLLVVPLVRLGVFQFLLERSGDAALAGRAVYGLPITQLDSFAAGAAIAVFRLEKLRHAGWWFILAVWTAACSGAAVLIIEQLTHRSAPIWSFGYPMFMAEHHQYVWGYTLLNVTAALAMICIIRGVRGTGILSWRPLSRLGKISYGVYVYHLPLLWITFSLVSPTGPAARVLLFIGWAAATIVVAQLSFRYLETPFLRLKDGIGSSQRDAARSRGAAASAGAAQSRA
jgi:peptidoglycan/LPS O-acetylase OafA/YrhL